MKSKLLPSTFLKNMDGEGSSSEAPVLISNAEVQELLKKRIAVRASSPSKRNKKLSNRLRHRDWIEKQVFAYLKEAPCCALDYNRKDKFQRILCSNKKQAVSKSGNGKSMRKGFDLTEAESLQILNCMPTEPVEIHLMIEDLQDRMPAQQQDELLALVKEYKKSEHGGAK